MKTLQYILFHSPRNIDDCLDYARENRPQRVCLELVISRRMDEYRELYQCKGEYRWEWKDRTIKCVEFYGCWALPEFWESPRKAQVLASRKIRQRINRIRHEGIHVICEEDRFERFVASQKRKALWK